LAVSAELHFRHDRQPQGAYHHRGAYLNALGNILVWGMQQHPVYLWTLPMFHCNGWCCAPSRHSVQRTMLGGSPCC
jgi:fatty-acyl-CoA synthase